MRYITIDFRYFDLIQFIVDLERGRERRGDSRERERERFKRERDLRETERVRIFKF